MTLEQFQKSTRATRFFRRVQVTAQTTHTRVVGTTYHVYICTHTLEAINPYTKKHAGREYRTFSSSTSADHAKELAYEYIKENS